MSYQLDFKIKYRYQNAPAGIAIPVSLTVGDLSTEVNAKLDTGAEFCFFQREIAEDLGLDVESGDLLRMATLVGSLTAYGHRVKLHTLGLAFESEVFFAAVYGMPRNLLGRRGWLEHLHLALMMDDETIYFNSIYPTENL